jgi:hypothetical protein
VQICLGYSSPVHKGRLILPKRKYQTMAWSQTLCSLATAQLGLGGETSNINKKLRNLKLRSHVLRRWPKVTVNHTFATETILIKQMKLCESALNYTYSTAPVGGGSNTSDVILVSALGVDRGCSCIHRKVKVHSVAQAQQSYWASSHTGLAQYQCLCDIIQK